MSAARRVALVIGNGAYQKAKPDLFNPPNDAEDVAARLSANNFAVTRLIDVTCKDMDAALHDFRKALDQAELGLFFFAGHGVQIEGENYLIATDTNTADELDAKYTSLPLNKVIDVMEKTATESNVIILDACRDNPFERAWRSGNQRGLASVYAPKGTLIAFATSPGQTADDGRGRNGAYTSALLQHIDTPDISIENMFKRVRNTLAATTQGKQISWEHTSLAQELYFRLGITNLIEDYSAVALSDALFVADSAQHAHRIITALKSHNWHTQNPATGQINAAAVAAFNSDSLFVIGRNIYQAACGSANNPILFVRDFAQRTQHFEPARRKAILDGMLFEIFFDSNAEVRSIIKGEYFDEVFSLQKHPDFADSFEFISNALAPHADRFYVLPGKAIAKAVDVVLRDNDPENTVLSVHMDGKNILRKLPDPFGLDDDDWMYITLNRDQFENRLSEETIIPRHLLKLTYSGAAASKEVRYPGACSMRKPF